MQSIAISIHSDELVKDTSFPATARGTIRSIENCSIGLAIALLFPVEILLLAQHRAQARDKPQQQQHDHSPGAGSGPPINDPAQKPADKHGTDEFPRD